MKPPHLLLICVVAVTLGMPACKTVKRVGKATSDLVTGGSDPAPESSWNSENVFVILICIDRRND